MELYTVGILSPGDMGHAIGQVLRQQGLRVLTRLQERSARTAALAAAARITAVEDDETLVRESQILLSILPPSQATNLAERVAHAVKQCGSSLLFADCNAVAPRTVKAIEQVITGAGASFVDVGIIGSPPRPGAPGPRLYASGPGAEALAQLQGYGLDVRIFGEETGQVSGLKMCYSSLTKGLTALACEAFAASDSLGVGEALTAELGAREASHVHLDHAPGARHASQSGPLGRGNGRDRPGLGRSQPAAADARRSGSGLPVRRND